EDTAECVVAWQAILEHQHILPKIRLHPRKQRHVGATRRSAQRRQQRDEQNLCQIVQRILRARVGQVCKALAKSSHRRLPPNQKPPSESTFPSLAMTYKSPHAIPLPVNGGGLGRGHATRLERSVWAPSPPLPRKRRTRGRERTERVKREQSGSAATGVHYNHGVI